MDDGLKTNFEKRKRIFLNEKFTDFCLQTIFKNNLFYNRNLNDDLLHGEAYFPSRQDSQNRIIVFKWSWCWINFSAFMTNMFTES